MSVPIERKILAAYAIGQGLNVGCGKIRLGNAVGVDIDPAVRTVDVVADGAALPFEDGSQDYVLALHNLEHYHQSTLIILREWNRVLKPGGICAVIVPDGDRRQDAFFAGSGQHMHIFTLQVLEDYFIQAGFEVQTCRKIVREPERPEQTILCVGKK